MPPRVVKERDVRRSEIVDVATELFTEHGYAGTTVADILRATGMAKGGFYHHFTSKDDVFAACVDRIASHLASAFVAALEDASGPARERIRAYVRHGYTAVDPSSRRGIVHDLHVHGDPDLHRQVIDGVEERVVPAFARTVAEGRDSGDFAVDGDPTVVAVAVVGMLRSLHERFAAVEDAAVRVPFDVVVELVERALGVSTAKEGEGT